MATIITEANLPADVVDGVEAAQLALMIAGANAKATRVAPCLGAVGDDAPTADQLAEARLILVGAVKRWTETGSGAMTQQTAGPFSQTTDTRSRSGYNLWPSEITQLQDVCATGKAAGAFSFSITPQSTGHLPWCDIILGGLTCTCGVALTGGYPIYELGGDTY